MVYNVLNIAFSYMILYRMLQKETSHMSTRTERSTSALSNRTPIETQESKQVRVLLKILYLTKNLFD
jgi:hypothetical protein